MSDRPHYLTAGAIARMWGDRIKYFAKSKVVP